MSTHPRVTFSLEEATAEYIHRGGGSAFKNPPPVDLAPPPSSFTAGKVVERDVSKKKKKEMGPVTPMGFPSLAQFDARVEKEWREVRERDGTTEGEGGGERGGMREGRDGGGGRQEQKGGTRVGGSGWMKERGDMGGGGGMGRFVEEAGGGMDVEGRATSTMENDFVEIVKTPRDDLTANDRVSIANENDRILAGMSRLEIQQAMEEIEAKLDPTILTLLRAKAAAANAAKIGSAVSKLGRVQRKSHTTSDSNLGWIRNEAQLKSAAKKLLPPNEHAKLRWMEEEEDPSSVKTSSTAASSTLSTQIHEPRFDLAGVTVRPDDEAAEIKNELYHHGDESNRAGYTIGELVHLSRSTVSTQRTLAARALSGILRRRSENFTTVEFRNALMDQGETVLALRLGLDFENVTALPHIIDALHAFCIPLVKYEAERDFVLGLGSGINQWGPITRTQGSPTIPSLPAREIITTKEEEEVDADDDTATDAEIAEASPIRALVKRTGFVERCVHLICRSNPPLVEISRRQLVEMLIHVARAYPECCATKFQAFDDVLTMALVNNEQPATTCAALTLANAVVCSSFPVAELACKAKWLEKCLRASKLDADHDGDVDEDLLFLWPIRARALCVWRSLLFFSHDKDLVVDRVGQLGQLIELVGEFILSGEGAVALIDFACAAFEVMTFYFTHFDAKSDKKITGRLVEVSIMATRFTAHLFGASTRLSAASTRFIGAYARASMDVSTENDDEFRALKWSALAAVNISPAFDYEGGHEDAEKNTHDRVSELKHACQLAVTIFAGHAVYLEPAVQDVWTTNPEEGKQECERFDALASCANTLCALIEWDSSFAEQIAYSSVVTDLWQRCCQPGKRTLRGRFLPPLSPLVGIACLSRDEAFASTLDLFVLIVKYCGADVLEFSLHEEMKNVLMEYLSQKITLGPRASERLAKTIVGALLTPTMMSKASAHEALELRTVMLSKFAELLGVSNQEDEKPTSLIACESSQVAKNWYRVGAAWPFLPLLIKPPANVITMTPAAVNDAIYLARAALKTCVFLERPLDGWPIVYAALLKFSCFALQPVLNDAQVLESAIKLLDSASNSAIADFTDTGYGEFSSWMGGEDDLKMAAARAAEVFCEESFGNELLERIVSFLLQPRHSPGVRTSAWNVLDRGNAFQHLKTLSPAQFAIQDSKSSSGDEEIALEAYVSAIENGKLNHGDILFDCVLTRIRRFNHSTSLVGKWTLKRANERLQNVGINV